MNILAVKALIFVLMALCVAVIFRPRYDKDRVSIRIISYWIGGAIIAFLTPVDMVKLPLLGLYLLVLTPPRLDDRAAYYICTLFALPRFVFWQIPFPGVNYLFRLDHAMLLSLVVAVPMLFASRNLKRGQKDPVPTNRFISVVFICTIFLISVLNMRDTTLTNALRAVFVTLFTYLVPYLALTRSLRSRDSFDSLIHGMTTVGALIAFLALLTVFQNWNHYDLAGESSAFASTSGRADSRRVNLTMMHTLAGLALSAGFAAFWYAARHAPKITVMAYPLLFLSFIGLLGTQARGAYLAFMIMIATIILFRFKSWGVRIALGGGGFIALIMAFLTLRATGFASIDAYGTFSYRDELLKAGLDYIWVHPFFGSTDYAVSPHFAHLVQGQGIIDFVNGYLQYVLRWGLVSLCLFGIVWMTTLLSTVRGIDRCAARGPADIQMKSFGLGLVGLYTAFLFTFGTTSDGSYYPQIMTLLIALAQSYGRVSKIPLSQDGEDESKKDEPKTHNTQSSRLDVTPGAKGAWS